jgi:hypothetical protein
MNLIQIFANGVWIDVQTDGTVIEVEGYKFFPADGGKTVKVYTRLLTGGKRALVSSWLRAATGAEADGIKEMTDAICGALYWSEGIDDCSVQPPEYEFERIPCVSGPAALNLIANLATLEIRAERTE